MSAEVGGVIFLPALIGVGLLFGIGAAMGGAANVIAERQRERLAAADRLSQARAEYEALRRRVNAARDRHPDMISELADPPQAQYTGKNPARVAALVAQLAEHMAQGENQLRRELAAARTAQLMDGLLASLPSAEAPGRRPPGSPPPPRQRPADAAQAVSRILGRLETAVPQPVVAELLGRAEQVLAVASPVRAGLLVDDLRDLVQQANEDVAASRRRAGELAARLSGYAGPEIDEARLRLCTAVEEPDPDWPGLARMADRAVEQTVATALRDYAAHALHESLAEIGCEVEEEFDTLLVRDGMAHVRRPGWGDLAVRVRVRPEDQAIHFNVIRPADVEGEIDQAAEHDWCSAFDSLLPILAGKGVEVRVDARSEIGSGRVQRIAPARYPFPRQDPGRRRGDDDDVRRERER